MVMVKNGQFWPWSMAKKVDNDHDNLEFASVNDQNWPIMTV